MKVTPLRDSRHLRMHEEYEAVSEDNNYLTIIHTNGVTQTYFKGEFKRVELPPLPPPYYIGGCI